jgi:acetylornithine deacetylase/succinyl-diaminopimelate desuccinylase-like protein
MQLSPVLGVVLWVGCAGSLSAQTTVDEHLRGIPWQRYQDEAVQLFQEYLRIDTSNPPGNELAAAEFFHRVFDQAGIPNSIYSYAPGRANFYAILKGDGSLPPLVLLNHTDVVQADPKKWRAPPFSGEIVDGEIWGRGAVDMKDEGLIHAMVMLIAARERLPLKRDLIFLATADEEMGGTGSAWIIKNHPELVHGAEYLITEGGSNLTSPGKGALYTIDVAEKIPFWIRMTARGRGGHGSIPMSDSATHRLARAMQRVVDWQIPPRLLPAVEQYFHQIAPLQPEPWASQLLNIRKALHVPASARALMQDENYNYLLHTTIALTVMSGGPQTNVIPDTAYCELDVRLLPGDDPDEFLRKLRQVVADDRIEMQHLNPPHAPNSSPTDTALYRIIEQAVHLYNPKAIITPALIGGYTENNLYRSLGIVCYGFNPVEMAPEHDASQHAANERLPVEQFRRGVKLLYAVVARVAAQRGEGK